MKILCILTVASVLLASCATHTNNSGQLVAALTLEQKMSLGDTAQWRRINTIKNLPAPLVGNDGIADPGQDYDRSDVVGGPRPNRRLNWAANKGDLYIISLDAGSMVGVRHMVFLLQFGHEEKVKVLWNNDGQKFENYEQVLHAITKKLN